jgi:hypothetical protein
MAKAPSELPLTPLGEMFRQLIAGAMTPAGRAHDPHFATTVVAAVAELPDQLLLRATTMIELDAWDLALTLAIAGRHGALRQWLCALRDDPRQTQSLGDVRAGVQDFDWAPRGEFPPYGPVRMIRALLDELAAEGPRDD